MTPNTNRSTTRAEYRAVCHAHRAARRHNAKFAFSDSPAWALARYAQSAPMPPRAFCASWAAFNHRQQVRRNQLLAVLRVRHGGWMTVNGRIVPSTLEATK